MIKRGDIYFIRDTRQSIGSEQKADRPAVIVSNDANNKHSGVYEVVYMTTQPKTDLPTHFITSSALRTSTVLCEQISSVYEERIGEWIGTLTPEEMKQPYVGNNTHYTANGRLETAFCYLGECKKCHIKTHDT